MVTMVLTEAGNLDAIKMLDSGANFPGPGVLADLNLLHHPGSYSGCLNINTDNPDTQHKGGDQTRYNGFQLKGYLRRYPVKTS